MNIQKPGWVKMSLKAWLKFKTNFYKQKCLNYSRSLILCQIIGINYMKENMFSFQCHDISEVHVLPVDVSVQIWSSLLLLPNLDQAIKCSKWQIFMRSLGSCYIVFWWIKSLYSQLTPSNYHKILHKWLQELRQTIYQMLDPQKTPHTST